MKKILTAIATVFLFVFTASFCNMKKDEPKQPAKEQPASAEHPSHVMKVRKYFEGFEVSVYKYENRDTEIREYSCYCRIENGEHTQTYLRYLNEYGESVILYLDEKDKVWRILLDNHDDNLLNRFQEYDCRELKNASLCESDKVKEKIAYYRRQLGWHARVYYELESATKNPKEHLEIPPFDKGEFELKIVPEDDYCGKNFCKINLVSKNKSKDGDDSVMAEYHRNAFPWSIGSIYLTYENTSKEDVYLILSETNDLLAFQYSLSPKYNCNDSQNKEICEEAKTVLKFFRDSANWDEILKQEIEETEEREDPLNHL